jgi:hypothetical protein
MIIGLVAYKASGKDVMADFLVQHFGFIKLSVAEPIKKVCRDLFQLNDEHFNDRILKETKIPSWGLSPREIMQKVGTDLFRHHFDDQFWVKILHQRIQSMLHQGIPNIVISDIRFQNEADVIHQHGGILVYIDRFSRPHDSHESEKLCIQGIDKVIPNRGSISQYREAIRQFINFALKDPVSDPPSTTSFSTKIF